MSAEVPASNRFVSLRVEITKSATADFKGNMILFHKQFLKFFQSAGRRSLG